jgi:ubiquinone/menaquinone biosynthesis C-methylase UbiE
MQQKNWEKEKEKEWKENSDFWIKIIREKLDPFREQLTNKAVLSPVRERKNLRILDAGCGEGYLCRKLVKMGHKVVGIDSSERLIKAAIELEKKKPLGIKYLLGDIRKTKIASASFDVILSHQVINEIENPEKGFQEFYRILKRKGEIVCLFLHPCFDFKKPNSLDYFSKKKIEKKHFLVSGIRSPYSYSYIHLPLSEWINILVKASFLILDIKEPHPSARFFKNKWWQENFSRPRFLLIRAKKN